MIFILAELGLILGFGVYRLTTGQWHKGLFYLSLAGIALLVYYRKQIVEDWILLRTDIKQWLYKLWKEWGEAILIAGVLALLIRTFILGPYKIPSGSMIPTFLIGDRIFVDKVSYVFSEPKRGDIIVFKFPQDKHKHFVLKLGDWQLKVPFVDLRRDFVKRLAGLPGEKLEIRGGKIFINGKPLDEPPFSDHYYYNQDDWDFAKKNQVIEIPPNAYFALGDNSAQSSDSRNWGFVAKENVVGRAFFIWWPPKRMKLVR